MGRRLRTHLDLMNPDVGARVTDRLVSQKVQKDKNARPRSYQVGDQVYVRNFGTGDKWVPGVMLASAGPRCVNITLSNQQVVRRHLDQVRGRNADVPTTDDSHLDIGSDPDPQLNCDTGRAASTVPVAVSYTHLTLPTKA